MGMLLHIITFFLSFLFIDFFFLFQFSIIQHLPLYPLPGFELRSTVSIFDENVNNQTVLNICSFHRGLNRPPFARHPTGSQTETRMLENTSRKHLESFVEEKSRWWNRRHALSLSASSTCGTLPFYSVCFSCRHVLFDWAGRFEISWYYIILLVTR